ncbi:MAG: carbon starvation protein A [Planctomycetes bacterium]|jgi:carbon starvation protein|nr:carbon starvation protein A [Planctomycetota bacterium]
MTPALAALLALVAYFLAYRFYGGFLARKVFRLDPDAVTPAHALRDGIDYVPSRPQVLFGHHFASITGLAPMLGPAIAVIWGWVPSLLWVVVGACFVGCVHDFSALVLSARSRGQSIGQVAEGLLGSRGRTLFHVIIFFGVSLAMGVFVLVIAGLFSIELAPGIAGYPQAVLPSGLLMVVAMVAGYLLYRRDFPLTPVILVGFAIELFSIWLGLQWPTLGLRESSWPSADGWKIILLLYAFAASVLPVWALLQSRDFLNSLLLYLGLGLAYVGFFVLQPEFSAPALVVHPEGAPPLLPFVFITIACGAVSGFHGLVSSGTTAKQLDKETHARPIGYGGMIGESLLALLATLACTAGFASTDLWHDHYGSWKLAEGLPKKIDAFIDGTTSFVTTLGLSETLASAMIAMVVVSFALTTLDSATRLLRFNVEEIAVSFRIPGLSNRYVATALACGSIALFSFYKVDGNPAGLALWGLFGTTNQLLAGLTLTVVTLYLKNKGRPSWPAAIPAVFMMGSTLTAMWVNLRTFAPGGARQDRLLLTVGGVLFALGLWLLIESILALRPSRSPEAKS